MNNSLSNSRQLDESKYTNAFWRRWRAFKERIGERYRRNAALPHEAKVILWELIDRANHLNGIAYAGSRGLGKDAGMDKDTANTMLHVLHEQRAIYLEPGDHSKVSIAHLLSGDGERWPGPGPDDFTKRVSDRKGQGVPPRGTGGVCTVQTQEPLKGTYKNLPSAGSLTSPRASALASPPVSVTMPSSAAKAQFDDLISLLAESKRVGPKRNPTG